MITAREQSGFTLLEGIFVIVLVVAMGAAGYVAYKEHAMTGKSQTAVTKSPKPSVSTRPSPPDSLMATHATFGTTHMSVDLPNSWSYSKTSSGNYTQTGTAWTTIDYGNQTPNPDITHDSNYVGIEVNYFSNGSPLGGSNVIAPSLDATSWLRNDGGTNVASCQVKTMAIGGLTAYSLSGLDATGASCQSDLSGQESWVVRLPSGILGFKDYNVDPSVFGGILSQITF